MDTATKLAAPTASYSSCASSALRLSSPPQPRRFFASMFSKTLRKPLHMTFSQNPISDIVSDYKNLPNTDSYFFPNDDDDKPREECGVVGIFGDPEASRLSYFALHALQHRGQEGAGIVVVHDGVLQSVTGVGLLSEVFNESKLAQLPGDVAIGHVRYSTAGSSMLKNVQPFVAGYRFGFVGVAHNGNLVNYQALRVELEDNGSISTPVRILRLFFI